MKLIEDLEAWQRQRRCVKGSVGFVPTMGALHAGHASLLERSVAECDVTVLSIYVNPTQFNNPDDLAKYPDTLDDDLALARTLGVDYVILPTFDAIYPDGFRYQVNETAFSEELCGADRPGHFTGVLTVVMKLLNLVQPARAYFGEKDFQQLRLIQDMVDAFFMPVRIVGCPTVRENDGLAMSSRNKLLDSGGRKLAAAFNRALTSGAGDDAVRAELQGLGFAVDYVVTRENRRFGAVVVQCGGHDVRLIDNVALGAAPARVDVSLPMAARRDVVLPLTGAAS